MGNVNQHRLFRDRREGGGWEFWPKAVQDNLLIHTGHYFLSLLNSSCSAPSCGPQDTTTSGSATSVEAGTTSGAGSVGGGGGGVVHEALPFDMPKLRRKLRAASSESSSTSQSSEPQEPQDLQPSLLQDLPFDMPKLRKKLSHSSGSSSASQSDPPGPPGPPALAGSQSFGLHLHPGTKRDCVSQNRFQCSEDFCTISRAEQCMEKVVKME